MTTLPSPAPQSSRRHVVRGSVVTMDSLPSSVSHIQVSRLDVRVVCALREC